MVSGPIISWQIDRGKTGNNDKLYFLGLQNHCRLQPWNSKTLAPWKESYDISFIVQWLSHVRLFVTPWTAARQASLFFTISWSLLKFMSIELVMLSNHLILCNPRLLLSPISHVLSISESRHPMFLSFKILKGAKLKLKESYISQSKSFHIFPHPNSAKAANWNFAEKNHLDAFHFLNNVQS